MKIKQISQIIKKSVKNQEKRGRETPPKSDVTHSYQTVQMWLELSQKSNKKIKILLRKLHHHPP